MKSTCKALSKVKSKISVPVTNEELKKIQDIEKVIIKRIHIIFERATRKFKGDLNLWIQYIRVAIELGSFQSAPKIFTK
jgi:hypothetical protein